MTDSVNTPSRPIDDALAIWQQGVDSVDSEQLVRGALKADSSSIVIGDQILSLNSDSRIIVIGGGKAGAGMASGIEAVMKDAGLLDRVDGWINVPEDCVRPLQRLHLHGARPAGVNEPTQAGVGGTSEILRLIDKARDTDVCLCLISGGGSALLPAPIDGVSLEDKQQITRLLSENGANIAQLNTVRKQLSKVKGGRLRDACNAGQMATLVISDVLGDPLDVIASGPTVENSTTASDALLILQQLNLTTMTPTSIISALKQQATEASPLNTGNTASQVHIIGNIQTAVAAATAKAKSLGYEVESIAHTSFEGEVNNVARDHANWIQEHISSSHKRALITGGEPVVTLSDANTRGKGGRNQQLVLAALVEILRDGTWPAKAVLISGGTDGEDGPTDAAGAKLCTEQLQTPISESLEPEPYLRNNDAYHFFEQIDGLIKTGPTHTNVCDIRVALIGE